MWFGRDVPAMAEALDTEPVLVVVRATDEAETAVTLLPVGTEGIPNSHLGYAVQWFSWPGLGRDDRLSAAVPAPAARKGGIPMRYVSPSAPELGFEDAMLTGLARDGGLYVPAEVPQLGQAEIAALAGLPYEEVAFRGCGRSSATPSVSTTSPRSSRALMPGSAMTPARRWCSSAE